ncbi:MAG: myo-inosose-2 dehydratase [Anaerolineae bacterium]
MTGMMIGCGQITWPRSVPEEQVLHEISQAGYEGAPAGPWSGRSPKELVALYDRYGLKPAPGYLGANFWVKEEEASILDRAREMARFARDVGCTELFVAANGFDAYTTARGKTRSQVSGHVQPEDMMTDEEFRQFAATLTRVGQITLEYGVRACFHNHVGSVIETREEIDRLFSLVDRSVVFQGPDIGHLVWGGVDPVDFCREYAESIKALHLKDIHLDVVERGREEEWDYQTYTRHGIFAELGEGCVDFPAIFRILQEAGFSGWLIVETDVTTKPSPFESARISREYLRRLGL